VQNSYPTLSMENVVLHSCASYPIEASIINYSVMGYVNAYNCPNRFLAIWDTNLYSSYTLPNTNVPYYLKSNLSWGSGAGFTLEPGVSQHFGQHGKIFFGGGASLLANGTEALPISFLAGRGQPLERTEFRSQYFREFRSLCIQRQWLSRVRISRAGNFRKRLYLPVFFGLHHSRGAPLMGSI
jgi:hypothetical protein